MLVVDVTSAHSASDDVLRPLLERTGDVRGAPGRVCYLHAPPGLGASHLVMAWLRRRDLWSRVTWCRGDDAASIRGARGAILVLEGSALPPDSREFEALVSGHERVIVIGTSAVQSWRAAGADVFTSDSLQLTTAEIAGVAERRQLDLTDAALGELASATAGWPVLVDLVLDAYGPGERVAGMDLGLAEARPHVAARVLRLLSTEQQTLIRLLAVSGGLIAEELEALGVLGVAGELRRSGLAKKDRADGPLTHRLLSLVGDAVAASVEPATADTILARLAEQREKLGVLDRGLGFARAAKAWPLVSRIIDRWGTEIAFSPHARLLQQVTWEIPPKELTRYPGAWHRAEYVGLLPLGRAPVRFPAAEDYPKLLERGAAPLVLKRAVMALVARRVHQRHADALEIVRRFRPFAERTVRPLHGRIASVTSYWFLQAGVALELAGEWDEATRYYRLGWQASRYDVTEVSTVDLAGKLATQAAWRGDAGEAEDWLAKKPTDLDPEQWYTLHVLSGFQQAAAVLAADRLDREQGERQIVELRRPTRSDEFWSWRLAAEVHHLLAWGEVQRARDAVRAGRRDHPESMAGDGYHAQMVCWLDAEIALAAGHGNRARRLIDQLEDPALAAPLAARLALLTGDLERAGTVTSLALRRSATRRQATQMLLIQAIVAHRRGDQALAATALARAIGQVRVAHDLRALCTVPRAALAALAADSVALQRLLERVDEAGGVQIHPDQVELVDLSDRETAVLEQLVRGRSLREAADELFVSVNTVKSQARALYRTLGVSDRTALAEEALRLGLVEPAD